METEAYFPITIQFEDGETEQYGSIEDLEMNLEDFDSDLDINCQVLDRFGRPMRLKIKLLKLQHLEPAVHNN